MLFPVALELNLTVPLLLRKSPNVETNEPPTVINPDGSVVEPLVKVIVLVDVALVSTNDHVPPPVPAKVILYAFEPLSFIVCVFIALNLRVPLFAVNEPPLLANEPFTSRVEDGSVTVPCVMVVLCELVALFEPNDHEPEPLNARS